VPVRPGGAKPEASERSGVVASRRRSSWGPLPGGAGGPRRLELGRGSLPSPVPSQISGEVADDLTGVVLNPVNKGRFAPAQDREPQRV
jgi:hypothetical protein